MEDGSIEFLGRADSQVKIRGQRLELGEVENALCSIEGISSAVVIFIKDSESEYEKNYLAGYFVSIVDKLDKSFVLKELNLRLPSYMIPSVLVQLESLPLNPSGKVDRNALPKVPRCEVRTNSKVLPTTDTQLRVCRIWKDVLRLTFEIGITDNFFELGGNSLLAIQLSSRINREFKIKNSPPIFKYPTVELFVSSMLPTLNDSQSPLVDVTESWIQLLSESEERIDLSGILSPVTKIDNQILPLPPVTELLSISGDILTQLQNVSREHNVSLNSMILYAWHSVLHAYGGGTRTTVGVLSEEPSGTSAANIIPTLLDHESMNVLESIQSVQEQVNSRERVDWTKFRCSGDHPLFDSLFRYGAPKEIPEEMRGINWNQLVISAYHVSDGLELHLTALNLILVRSACFK